MLTVSPLYMGNVKQSGAQTFHVAEVLLNSKRLCEEVESGVVVATNPEYLRYIVESPTCPEFVTDILCNGEGLFEEIESGVVVAACRID